MPNTVVDIDLRSETGAVPQQTYSDLIVLASEPDIDNPIYNDPQPYDNSAEVRTDFGPNSDAYISSLAIEEMGARTWWVVMLDSTQYTETIANSDTSAVQEGSASNTPFRGGLSNITVALDGTAQTVVPTTETAPVAPSTGEAKVNFDTGRVVTGAPSSGMGTGIEVTYESLTWNDAFTELSPRNFDLAIMADVRADKSYIGDMDSLIQWGSSNHVSSLVAYANGSAFSTDATAMDEYHDMGSYISSGNLLTVAHKSDDDVAGAIAGRLSTKRSWFDPFWDGAADFSFTTGHFRPSLIGSPAQPGTMEGGDASGNGPTNVIKEVNGTLVLSNSLTTAGAASNYQYFDVRRTETFIESEIEQSLEALRLRRDQIPFADIGRTLITDALTNRLNKYVSTGGVGGQLPQEEEEDLANSNNPYARLPDTGPTGTEEGGVPLRNLEVFVPRIEDLSPDDRANRRWTGIQVIATLAGNVHTFNIELTVQV